MMVAYALPGVNERESGPNHAGGRYPRRMSGDRLAVSPDALRQAGQAVMDTADQLKRQTSTVVGEQEADANANPSFATARAEAACESGWEQALSVLGAGLAIAGDTLNLNATNYATTEQTNAGRFGPK
jgi:uncharacterized protein YukE